MADLDQQVEEIRRVPIKSPEKTSAEVEQERRVCSLRPQARSSHVSFQDKMQQKIQEAIEQQHSFDAALEGLSSM